MMPPIECDLGYRFRTQTLNPNPNPNLNPNPKTDPDPNPNANPNPKSNNNNVCSAKRHPNKVQDSVINMLFSLGRGWVYQRPIPQSSSKR